MRRCGSGALLLTRLNGVSFVPAQSTLPATGDATVFTMAPRGRILALLAASAAAALHRSGAHKVHRAPGSDAPLWSRPGRPVRPDAGKLGDYGNIAIWPLPASATQIGNTKIDPSAFKILVPSADPFLLEVGGRGSAGRGRG